MSSAHSQMLSSYQGDNEPEFRHQPSAVAERAFQDGMNFFKHTLTKDEKKRIRLDGLQASNLQDVLQAAHAAHASYESRRTGSKTRECITAFAARIRHYGNVMDIMVQHHPEYVSLAWGTMKVLFGAVIEHENTGRTILTALNDIADALPRVELATVLYPTEVLQRTVAFLYAHIIRFLLRAMEWHNESRLKHALHSVTRPASLRYDDLIAEIKRESQHVTDLSMSSSQVEQREIHDTVRELRGRVVGINRSEEDLLCRLSTLTTMVVEMRDSLARDQAINADARIEFRYKLNDIQLVQALGFVSSHCSIDHTSSIQRAAALRNRHRVSIKPSQGDFATSPKLRQWDSSSSSSAILLKATFRQRQQIRDFCVSVVEQLTQSKSVCLWILRASEEHSASEFLKSLILQAMSIDRSSHTDVKFSFKLQTFLDARCEGDYVSILGEFLQRFRLVYIIVDTGAVTFNDIARCRAHLRQLSRRLAEHNARTVIKVLVSSYGPAQIEKEQQCVEDIVLDVGRSSVTSRRRKGKSTNGRTGNMLKRLEHDQKR